jgi:hypothetical protein
MAKTKHRTSRKRSTSAQELRLYWKVRRAMEKRHSYFKGHGVLEAQLLEEDRFEEHSFEGRNVYIFGESHGSIKPLESMHKVLPKLLEGSDPSSCLFLVEDYEMHLELNIDPKTFYFDHLTKIYSGVSVDTALADIHLLETREKMCELGIREDQIDHFLINLSMAYESEDDVRDNFQGVIRRVAENCRKPESYIRSEIKERGLIPLEELEQIVPVAWNQVCRERFLDLISGQYADKPNIVVSCGYGHNEVFRPPY